MSFFRILDYLPTCHHSSSLRPAFTVFGTKDNWHSKRSKNKDVWKQSKTKQGNLKTVKLTEKQSHGTSQSTLKTAKKVVMGKLKTGEKFEKVKHQLWGFFFETHLLHCCEKNTFTWVFSCAKKGLRPFTTKDDKQLAECLKLLNEKF